MVCLSRESEAGKGTRADQDPRVSASDVGNYLRVLGQNQSRNDCEALMKLLADIKCS